MSKAIARTDDLQGAPDLVVEILSPSTRSRDLRLKRNVYELTGVTEYWVFDPERDVVYLHRRTDAGTFADPMCVDRTASLTSPLLPGFALPLDKVFA